MNPTTSPLQQQYPLSPKKFWKKMFEKLVGWYILAIGGAGVICLVLFLDNDINGTNTGGIMSFLGIAIALVLIFLAAISIAYSWYVKAYIKGYFYAGEEHFITIKKGVFSPAEIHVQWQKIQDVYVDQDIVDRIMGLYDVHIASATAASGIEAHIDGVDQASAEGLKKFLLDKVSNASKGIFTANVTGSASSSDGAASASQTQAQAAQAPARAATITLSEEISSKRYPLSGKWVGIRIVGNIISPFLYWALIAFIIFGKTAANDVTPTLIGYFFLGYIAVSILSAIVHIVGTFIWKKNYSFEFGSDNIYYREGIISLSEKHMPYSSIQDVTVKQGILERLVGLASVRIENAAQQMIQTRNGKMPAFAGIIIQGVSIADANKIADIIKKSVLSRNTSGYGL